MRARGEGPRVGVLAEHITDCDAIAVLVRRIYAGKQIGVDRKQLGIDRYGAHGASILRRKLRSQIKRMLKQGCSAFIIVHDLDRDEFGALNDEDALFRDLTGIVDLTDVDSHFVCICIPAEELEAWFWSDQAVLDKVAGDRTDKAHPNPRLIRDPKGKLEELSQKNGKARHSPNANKDLAVDLDMDVCAQRCPEFATLREFVQSRL